VRFNCKNFFELYIIDLESFLNYFPKAEGKTVHTHSMLLRMIIINGVEKVRDATQDEQSD